MQTDITFQNEVGQIAIDVFSSMVALDITFEVTNLPFATPFDLESEVGIEGAWNGALIVRTTKRQATQWATQLLSIAPEEQDTCDALAEITNMVGGNLKAILPPKNQLQIPVVRQYESLQNVPVAENVNSFVTFDSPNGMFSILLTKTD